MGTLTDVDQNYLAQNFLAFFRATTSAVARRTSTPAGCRRTRASTSSRRHPRGLRAGVRPPLKDISFGRTLLRLFQTGRRFNVEIQPQLVMLQKTLLNIEGLGRQLDPELDLWTTAKPFLERWMANASAGWLANNLKREAPQLGPPAAAAAAPGAPGARPKPLTPCANLVESLGCRSGVRGGQTCSG
jgi:ubiquinone biosynthesis protein